MDGRFLKRCEDQVTLEERLSVYRISSEEYQLICDTLGRPPEGVEWALYSALWSEHCSYKSSKVHLKKMFSESPRLVAGFGENAGVIDLGKGERVGFKIESHNHPSFIEPFQGAATGVGGILRDIFTMGARPIALANYLCFGTQGDERLMNKLVKGVVKGISHYGNCVGVPTLTGQTEFHPTYNDNILVNALAVGYFGPEDKMVTSCIPHPHHWLIYVGAKTGRDGVHGASMASESFDEESESKRPTVQIGDPFLEKLLIESCLEVMKLDLVEAIQDMGAAGLTSSSFEMSSKSGLGLEIHLDQVPCRDQTIGPEEILLSESQERMLLVCRPENFDRLKSVFEHWHLDAVKIGQVREEKNIQLFWKGDMICDIDPDVLCENAPEYERPYKAITSCQKGWTSSLNEVEWGTKDLKGLLLNTLSSKEGGSRRWIFEQYDQRVGGATVKDCAASVAVVRLPHSGRALGLVLGGQPALMRAHAGRGGIDAVARPCLELSIKGFEPLALTNCLNYGNPENSEIMSEFVATVESMSEQCREFQVPIISGNVSLYNETLEANITSTPSTGVVGLKDEVTLCKDEFSRSGEVVFAVKLPQSLSSTGHWVNQNVSQYYNGDIDTQSVVSFSSALRDVVNKYDITATRLVGKFGRLYALARMCMGDVGFVGAEAYAQQSTPQDAAVDWLIEPYYEVLLSVSADQADEVAECLKSYQCDRLGLTEEDRFSLLGIQCSMDELRTHYESCWRKNFEALA